MKKFLSNLNAALDLIIEKRQQFALIFVSVSFATFGALYLFGFMPEELKSARRDAPDEREVAPAELAAIRAELEETKRVEAAAAIGNELPTRVTIGKIGVDAKVVNPTATDIPTLDAALKYGAVRYPTSGRLGQGNMFLFGHSTNRRIVNNQAYKTFNGLDKLNIGDEILVWSQKKVYVYKVHSVRLTTADEAMVDLVPGRNMLTLSTCNTFGAKQERFVVEADFVEARTPQAG